jgi:branched-chain amino acid transport system substrate-binding protein
MNSRKRLITRRAALKTMTAIGAVLAAPAIVRAQSAPLKLATLLPLSGAGGPYGPAMRKSAVAVVAAVNKAGGLFGQEVQYVSEDSQTNPEAAVRAARKLIDVDKVSGIAGTWASSVTTAIAPLCWENKVMIGTLSGADSITKLPHQGFIVRTQPIAAAQLTVGTKFMLSDGANKLAAMAVQTPFAQVFIDSMTKVSGAAGKSVVASTIYEADKTSYRSEVDKILRAKPDYIFLGGYTPDTIVLLRDLFRAGYKGKILAAAFAVNEKLLKALPQEVTQDIRVYRTSPNVSTPAYKQVQAIQGTDNVDPFSTHVFDHMNLLILAAAAAGKADGAAMRDAMRSVSQGGGVAVSNAVEGIKLLSQGKSVDYAGATGPCDFDKFGDVTSASFRYDRINKGKAELVTIM